MKPSERDEFVITIALLRGAEITEHWYVVGRQIWRAAGCGYEVLAENRRAAAEEWLKRVGVHISLKGEVADLSTKVEG